MKASREEAERNKRVLQQLLRQSQNKECADCTAKGPTWSAINWGVFVCIKCAGIHRKLGVHISKVKSCTLDDWITKDVELVTRVQNVVQRRMYEYKLPSNRRKPSEHDDIAEIERFIRTKYEKRAWMCPGAERGAAGVPPGGFPQQDVGSSPATPSSEANNSDIGNSQSFSNDDHQSRNGGRSSSNDGGGSSQRRPLRLDSARTSDRAASISVKSSAPSSPSRSRATENGFNGIARRHSPATPTSGSAPQTAQPSQDDLLSFDAPEKKKSNTDHAMESLFGGSSTNAVPSGGMILQQQQQQQQQQQHPQNNGNFANMNTSPTGLPASQGSKNDILSLFDQPPRQYGFPQQGPYGQPPMMMMMNGAAGGGGGGAYYGMPPGMGYGYGGQMPAAGQYGHPNAGGYPMMYNNAGGGFQQPQPPPQQQQQQQQQRNNMKW